MVLTPERLREIRERCERATKGPWWSADGYIYDSETAIGSMYAEADNDFVVHARDDVPTLVAEVERLHALLGELRDLLSRWRREAARYRRKADDAIDSTSFAGFDGKAMALIEAASDLEDVLNRIGAGVHAQ